jgi:hypothetical protein
VSQYGANTHDPDRPTFPALVDAIGEDPARYLYDRDRWVSLARIRGIHRFEVIEAWRAVERNLASHQGRDPRGWVMSALDEREAYLQEHGEFDPDVDYEEPETGPYTPDQWERDAGGLPPITPHAENIVEPVADGGEDGDQS